MKFIKLTEIRTDVDGAIITGPIFVNLEHVALFQEVVYTDNGNDKIGTTVQSANGDATIVMETMNEVLAILQRFPSESR